MKKHFLLLLMAFFSLTGWALDISNFNVTIQGTGAWEYTGEAQAPIVLEVKMPNATQALEAGVDYKVVYYNANNQEIEIANVINAGTYYVAARGIGDNEGQTQKLLFEVAPKSIASFTAVLPDETFDYDGTKKEFQGEVGLKWVKTAANPDADPPVAEVAVNLVKGTDFDFTYANNSEVGQAKIVFSGQGNYKGFLEQAFTINKGTLPTDITKYTFEALKKNPVYSGSPVTTIPSFTVKNVNAKDFTIRWKKADGSWVTAGTEADPTTYPNPTDAGTYTAWIFGTGNYEEGDGITGTNPAWTMTIERAPLQVYVDEMKKTYDGKAIATTGTPAIITGATIKFTGWKGNDSQIANITNGVTAQFAEGVTNDSKVGTYNMVPVVAINAAINNNYEVNPITTAYTIEKRKVFVAAKEQKFKFTGAVQNLNTTVSATTVEIVAADDNAKTGLVGNDKLETIKDYIQISLKEGVTIQAKENTAYTGAILITETAPENAAGINYTIQGVAGNVVMESEKMVFIPANVEKPYGYTIKPVDFKLVKTTSETIEGAEFAITDADNKVWTATDGVLPIGTYTITVTNAKAITPANYDFNPDFVYTGELTITKKVITPNIKTQVVAKGSGLVTTVDMVDFGDQLVDPENDKIAWTLAFNTGEDEGQIAENQIEENKIKATADDATYAAGIKIVIPTEVDAAKYANAKYTIKSATGKLIVGNGGSNAMSLDRTAEDAANQPAAQIAEHAGETLDVTFGALPMNAKEWYAMVLPFETTPAEIVKTLGAYVVVNKLASSTLDDENNVSVKFNLEMDKIEAGTPFLIKPNQDVNWNVTAITSDIAGDLDGDGSGVGAVITNNNAFKSKKIVEEITPTETDKAIFTGVYTTGNSVKFGQELDGTANDDMKYRWLAHKEYKGDNNWKDPVNAAHDLAPMEAFLILDKQAHRARVFVEDIDENGATAIKSISTDDINGLNVNTGVYTLGGVKIQGVPTQKGVYIKNGKKVIVR